jgi:site-specific DNA-methyltransferase (adenine-specific)
MSANLLYYGDNLDVLRRHVKDESVDLVYLDPPFNSNANYNVLFAEKDGRQAAGQMQAFEDTWRWDEAAARLLVETVEAGGRVADVLLAFERFLGTNDMLAYLVMMAPRLVELRRVLKPSGSLYLHCDPTASHYLKLLLDAVFGPDNFRNEIIWKRKAGRGETNNAAIRFGVTADSILFYARSKEAKFFRQYRDNNPEYIASKFTHVDADGRRYRLDNITSPSYRPNLIYEYKGITPPPKGWAVSQERMAEMDREGRLYIPQDPTKRIQRKRFLDELEGETVDTLWDDISPINSQAQERLGYPTQKPVALLERIIAASTLEGDVVLDPFCGCGTTVDAAQKMGRSWIGIDVTHLAISLIKVRLRDAFGDAVRYKVIGEPTTAEDAAELAESDKYQFQWWALGLVGARPVDQKKGADKGIDGRLYFHDGGATTRQIIFSVKGGHLKATDVRDLRGVVDREKADMGVLLSFEAPTKLMKAEAASAGFYTSPWGKHARLQLLTVAELLDGASVDYPRTAGVNQTFKQAPRQVKKVAESLGLFDAEATHSAGKRK